jgi:hypothetical protein
MIFLHYPDGRPVSLEECDVTSIEPARNGGTLIWVGSQDDSLAIHAREDYAAVQTVLRQAQPTLVYTSNTVFDEPRL